MSRRQVVIVSASLAGLAALAVGLAIVFDLRGFLHEDRCLDSGGRWAESKDRCEFNRSTCETRGGRYAPRTRGCEVGQVVRQPARIS